MDNAEKSADFRKQMGEWLEDETGQPTEAENEDGPTQDEEEWIDIDVSQFDEGPADNEPKTEEPEVEPAKDVVEVQRMIDNMISDTNLQAAILRVGMDRYNDGDSLSPRQQGTMELARLMFADGITTPEQVNGWLIEQIDAADEQETEPATDDVMVAQLAEYRDLEPGSPEEIMTNLDIITDMLREADVPSPENHAIELRAALRKQSEMTDDDQELLRNLRGIVEQKARALRTGETEVANEDLSMPEIDSVMISAYESTKMMMDGADKDQAIDELLGKLMPADTDRKQYFGLLSTFMKGDAAPNQALQAVQKQLLKKRR